MNATVDSGSASRSRRVLIIACLAAFMAFLDATVVNIAFPALQKAFHSTDTSSVSWVLNAYNIVFAALLVPVGQFADRYSRRTLFLVGLVIFTVASALCAAAPTLLALVGFRIVQAVGAAILIPTGMALLLPAFSPKEQIRAIALLAAVSGVAFAAGPSVGGTLIHTVGWEGIFLINLPIGALTLLLSMRFLADGERARGDAPFPDLVGACLMLLGVGSVALAIVQGNIWGWAGDRTLGSLGLGILLIAGAVTRAKATQRHAPAIQIDLFKARRFSVANISIFAFSIGLAAKLLCDVLFMTSVWGYSELTTGAAVSASPLITAAVATSAARLSTRIGARVGSALGGMLYAAGCLWYVMRMTVHPHYLTAYLPGAVLTGVGIALILPTLTSTAMLAVPPGRLAAGAGLNSMVRQIGAVLGVALFIAVVGSPSPANALNAFHKGWALAAIASAVAGLSAAVGLLARRTASTVPLDSLRNQPTQAAR